MKGIIRIVCTSVIAGAAYAAGSYIWENVLEDKATRVLKKIREKKRLKRKQIIRTEMITEWS